MHILHIKYCLIISCTPLLYYFMYWFSYCTSAPGKALSLNLILQCTSMHKWLVRNWLELNMCSLSPPPLSVQWDCLHLFHHIHQIMKEWPCFWNNVRSLQYPRMPPIVMLQFHFFFFFFQTIIFLKLNDLPWMAINCKWLCHFNLKYRTESSYSS